MGYIGNQAAEGYSSIPAKQDLTGATGTSLTLTHPVSSAESIDLFINNVRQEPTTAYTVAGTTVTLTGSVIATDDIYVVYNGLALQTTVPPDGSVTSAKLSNNAVTMDKLATSGTLPALNGSALTNIGGALTGVSEQTATGNSEVDFTGIPSGVELVKFTAYGVSASAPETLDIRIGDSGGFETTGYGRQAHNGTTGFSTGGSSASGDSWKNYGFLNATNVYYMRGELVHAGSNRWMMEARFFFSNADQYFSTMFGHKELSGELDRIRFYVASGTFDAGTFRIMYA